MCIQLPCRNIEVSTVNQLASAVITHDSPVPSGNAVPGGTACNSSPGIRPSVQTERDSVGSLPSPWSQSHAATFAAVMA